MEFKIENIEVFGLRRSIVASGNPMRTTIREEASYEDKDLVRAFKLGSVDNGTGHDNFLKGITVYMDIYAPLFMWKQLQRYHWFEIVSSQSTMHSLKRFNIEEQVVSDVDPIIMQRYNELLLDYKQEKDKDLQKEKWRTLIASLPSGFILGATIVTNYLQLKTICKQRKNHKLKEWKVFIDECIVKLPCFQALTSVVD